MDLVQAPSCFRRKITGQNQNPGLCINFIQFEEGRFNIGNASKLESLFRADFR